MKNHAPRLPDAQYACNFADIQKPLTAAQADIEASRCLFCFEAPCITACPTHIDIPSFIQKIASDNPRGSARVILDANPLGVQLDRQRDRETAGLQVAQTQLTQLQTAIEYQKSSLSAELEVRAAELRQSQARLDELLAGSRKQEIEQATAAVAEARAQNIQAQRDWERAQELFKNNAITASQHDQYKTRLDATTAALKQAERPARTRRRTPAQGADRIRPRSGGAQPGGAQACRGPSTGDQATRAGTRNAARGN